MQRHLDKIHDHDSNHNDPDVDLVTVMALCRTLI